MVFESEINPVQVAIEKNKVPLGFDRVWLQESRLAEGGDGLDVAQAREPGLDPAQETFVGIALQTQIQFAQQKPGLGILGIGLDGAPGRPDALVKQPYGALVQLKEEPKPAKAFPCADSLHGGLVVGVWRGLSFLVAVQGEQPKGEAAGGGKSVTGRSGQSEKGR